MEFELQKWSEEYRDAFARMHRDAEVMADLGGPFSTEASHEKFDRYRDAWMSDGISRWAVIGTDQNFLGYVGVMKRPDPEHPLGPHYDIGWRFCRDAWGKGYAICSTRRALAHAWTVLTIRVIFSYTASTNMRSRRVMDRLELKRATELDFTAQYPRGIWSGLVWVADRPVIYDRGGEPSAQQSLAPVLERERTGCDASHLMCREV